MLENITPSRVCTAGILRPHARAWLIEQGASIESCRGLSLIFLPITLFHLHDWRDGHYTIERWAQEQGNDEGRILGMASMDSNDNAYEVEVSSYWDTVPARKTPETNLELEDLLQEQVGRCEIHGVTISSPSSNVDGAYHVYPTGQPRTASTDMSCPSLEEVLEYLSQRYNLRLLVEAPDF